MPIWQVTCVLPLRVRFCGYYSCWGAGFARQDRESGKTLFERVPRFQEILAIDTKFGTLMELNERNSMVHAILRWGA